MNDIKKFILGFITTLILTSTLQAEIPYALDSLLQYEPTTQGFSYTTFEDSMEWQRDKTSEEFFEDKDVKAVRQNYINFCHHFKSLPKQNYSIIPTKYSIPPIIHLIWLGSEASPKVLSAFDSWQKYHPNWDIKIWTDKELTNFDWSSPKMKNAFEQAITWAEKTDVLRLEVLYKFGGIYSDADVVCVNSFQDLIVQNIGFFSCFELNYIGKHYGEPFFVGSAIMGAAKNSHVLKYCLDHLQTAEEAPTVGIIKRTGPGLISRACQNALLNNKENILILPCSYLYPLPWKKREVTSDSVTTYLSPETLAIHLWDGSWCPPKKKK